MENNQYLLSYGDHFFVIIEMWYFSELAAFEQASSY